MTEGRTYPQTISLLYSRTGNKDLYKSLTTSHRADVDERIILYYIQLDQVTGSPHNFGDCTRLQWSKVFSAKSIQISLSGDTDWYDKYYDKIGYKDVRIRCNCFQSKM